MQRDGTPSRCAIEFQTVAYRLNQISQCNGADMTKNPTPGGKHSEKPKAHGDAPPLATAVATFGAAMGMGAPNSEAQGKMEGNGEGKREGKGEGKAEGKFEGKF